MSRADSGPRPGTVHTVHDAVVVRFAPECLPLPTSRLISRGDKDAAPAQVFVVAQLDRETVRALHSPPHVPQPGAVTASRPSGGCRAAARA